MKLGYDTKFALVVYQGAAEVVRVRKDRGPGHTLFLERGPLDFSEYEEQLDVYTAGPEDGSFTQTVHVVATANSAALLPAPGTIHVPDRRAIDTVLPEVSKEIARASLSKQMKDYLALLLVDLNRATIAHPFLADAGGDSTIALKMAIGKLSSWESALFSGIEARVRDTVAPVAAPRPQEAEGVVGRAQATKEDSQAQCKEDLQKVLADAMKKIGEIDRRVLACGPAPVWRKAMNEVYYAALQVSRTLEFEEPTVAPDPMR
jgi:hypothetical protein